MPFDAHRNLAIATVVTPPSPSTTGTNIILGAGEGDRFPIVPFNATIWPAGEVPNPINAEIVRVTFQSGDTIGVTRAQEGTAARAIVAGDLVAATITVKTLTDVEAGTNFPILGTASDVVFQNDGAIRRNTADGADTGLLQVTGGGQPHHAYGAVINLYGNEHAGRGSLELVAGSPNGAIDLLTNAVIRGRVHPSGGFTWGGAFDPGVGTLLISAATPEVGNAFTQIAPGLMLIGNPGTDLSYCVIFHNASGSVGHINTSGSVTNYVTTSDTRLKQDRGVLRTDASGDVLRALVVHEFTWTVDGAAGRGVFAQEAVGVAPFAVHVGTDAVDDAGRLQHPWGVDYGKFVPDLIVGWQAHEAQVAALTAQVAALEARLAALEAAASAPPPE